MADPSIPENLVKETTSYDADSGTDKPLPKTKRGVHKAAEKRGKGPAYAPRKSARARAYRKQLDEAGNY